MRLAALAALVLVASAGCLGDLVEGLVGDSEAGPPAVARAIACPPGETRETNPGVCVGTLLRADGWLGEPSVAADPARPGLLALGVNAASLAPAVATMGGLSARIPSAGAATLLYVSEDGAATWRQVGLPQPSDGVHGGDPTLAFTPDGALHLAELVIGAPNSLRVHSTPDLGRTWRSSTVAQGVDRPWLSRLDDGSLALTWQASPARTGLAWSADGSDWTVLETAVGACNLQTPLVDSPAGQFFACIEREGDFYFAAVFAVDRAAATVERVARLWESGSGTLYLDRDPDGALRLLVQSVVDKVPSARAYLSLDGRDWEPPEVNLRAAAAVEDAWDWRWNSWMVADSRGASHVVVVGGQGDDCFRGTCDDAAQRRQVAWVSVAADGSLLAEALLTPADPSQRERPEGSRLPLGRALADDYAAAVRVGDAIFLAWGHDGGIDYTLLR